ncbi:MAG TPA: ABC transporter substrate-binding protein [Anaerolineae bacterium]|nr:ABC transporter substrate-binding protein [Anaerolineae bacterium]
MKKLSYLLCLLLLLALLIPAAVAAAPPQQTGGNYIVQADDTLGKIADKEYGNPLAYTAIVYYNNLKAAEDTSLTLIEDPNVVEPGSTIYLPTPEEANAFLIGNLPEGLYSEAPMLAAMVEAGELPPVQERLPQEPLIVPVVEEIGQYGGTLRRAFLGPSDANNYVRVVYDALVRNSPDGGQVIPHIAAGWESNPEFTSWTIRLRRGAKWSDGQPFTADDIMFWYNDILLNTDLTPKVSGWMLNKDGSTALVEKVSDTAVRWTYSEPNTTLLLELANKDGADGALNNLSFVPAHYMQQFHPNYVSEAELQQKVSEAGFNTWVELFSNRVFATLNAERPTMAAWVPDNSTVSDPVFTLKRNPYFIGVDPAGNQLPYLDEVRFTFYADAQALNLAAIAGEFDMQARHINMLNYPVLVENEPTSNYHVITWSTFGGSDAAITFSQTYQANPAIGELLRNKNFRIAMSHALNREEIKELAFLGLGEARQPVPAPNHPYYPGDEYAFRYTEYNPDLANQLLDEIGLTGRDDEGFRTLPNGERLDLELSVVPAFGPWPDVGQLAVQQWGQVGVRAHVEIRERALHFQLRDSNDLMMEIWNEDTTGFPFTGQPKMDPRSSPTIAFAQLHGQWYRTNGAEGLEPPAEIAQIVDIIDEAKTVSRGQQIQLAQELFQLWADNVWEMGTVGLTPMVQGVVVVNDNLYNVPTSAGNDWPLRTPGNTRPEQFFFKQP